MKELKRVDIVGSFLSVAWSMPLVFALQEAGELYPWKSATVIATLTLGAVLLLTFGFYEAWVTRRGRIDPTFPITLLVDGVVSMLLLCVFPVSFLGNKVSIWTSLLISLSRVMFTSGFIFYVAIIQIPQRFQIVNGRSSERSGILLLPMTIVTPTIATLAGSAVGKRPSICEYITLLGSVFILVGTILMGLLPTGYSIPSAQYGYQVILGIGLGLIMPPVLLILRLTVSQNRLGMCSYFISIALD